MITAIEEAVSRAGSQAELARKIKRKKQTVHSWVKGSNQIPPDAALDIEAAVGVSAYLLVFEPVLKARK